MYEIGRTSKKEEEQKKKKFRGEACTRDFLIRGPGFYHYTNLSDGDKGRFLLYI